MYLTFKHSRILEKSQSYKKILVKYCIIAKIHIPQMYIYNNQYLVFTLPFTNPVLRCLYEDRDKATGQFADRHG